MDIWAFDLATRCGVAHGHPPRHLGHLDSYTVNIRQKPDETLHQLTRNFRKYLLTMLEQVIPDMIVWEAPMSPQVKFERHQNDGAILLPHLLQARLLDISEEFDIPVHTIHPNTMRAAFLGAAYGRTKRKDIKRAMIEQGQIYGYLPNPCGDDNRADAVGHWHYAQRKWGNWTPPVEVLFGKAVRIAANDATAGA